MSDHQLDLELEMERVGYRTLVSVGRMGGIDWIDFPTAFPLFAVMRVLRENGYGDIDAFAVTPLDSFKATHSYSLETNKVEPIKTA